MKYDEAMAGPDKDKWKQAVKEEHEQMINSNVFEVVPHKDIPEGSKILTSTWAMKKKASGVYHARMNARESMDKLMGNIMMQVKSQHLLCQRQ
jgi:hypothetical protein